MQKLAAKFIEVMKECSHIAKNGENNFHGYKYAASADVLQRVNTSLVAHGIASMAMPEIVSQQDVTTAKGNIERLVTVKMDITLIDKESGEMFQITGLGSGQDSGDKAVMKAQTAAIKYAYMLSLAVSTGDDPEADRRTDEGMAAEAVAGVISPRTRTVRHSRSKAESLPACSDCGVPITEKVMQFSVSHYGRPLCMDCQKKLQGVA